MIRHAAAAAIAILLGPSWLCAQTAEFTVTVQSATVYKAPSTASPEIGRASRDAVLVVTRDLGSWVRVSWPDAPDGVGFVHETMGTMTNRATREERLAAAVPTARATPGPATSAPGASMASVEPVPRTGATYVVAPTHIVGLGGRIGGPHAQDFGATARIWSRSRFGIQVEASRTALTSDVAPGRLTSVQFVPAAFYSLRDKVTDNFWLRPYLGAGAALRRSTLKLGPADVGPVTDNGFSIRTFGGAELTFPTVPRFAVSADAGYVWSETPFPGFELGGFGFSLSGHWYVK